MTNLFGGWDAILRVLVIGPAAYAPWWSYIEDAMRRWPGNGGTSVGGGAGRGAVDEVRAVVLETDGSFTVVGESPVDRILPGDR